jgi:hypothetical protein
MTNDPLHMLQMYHADPVTLRLAIERHARVAQREMLHSFARGIVSMIRRRLARSPARAAQ